jgi:hypothetical protein
MGCQVIHLLTCSNDSHQHISTVKDGLAYHDEFDGAGAVDKISFDLKTTNGSVALSLGCSLDAQDFENDITYDH